MGLSAKLLLSPTLSRLCPTPQLGVLPALNSPSLPLSFSRQTCKFSVKFTTWAAQEKLSYHFLPGDWGNESHSSPPHFESRRHRSYQSEGFPALVHITCLPPWRTAWNITYNKQIMPKMFIKPHYFKIKTLYNLVAIYIASSNLWI